MGEGVDFVRSEVGVGDNPALEAFVGTPLYRETIGVLRGMGVEAIVYGGFAMLLDQGQPPPRDYTYPREGEFVPTRCGDVDMLAGEGWEPEKTIELLRQAYERAEMAAVVELVDPAFGRIEVQVDGVERVSIGGLKPAADYVRKVRGTLRQGVEAGDLEVYLRSHKVLNYSAFGFLPNGQIERYGFVRRGGGVMEVNPDTLFCFEVYEQLKAAGQPDLARSIVMGMASWAGRVLRLPVSTRHMAFYPGSPEGDLLVGVIRADIDFMVGLEKEEPELVGLARQMVQRQLEDVMVEDPWLAVIKGGEMGTFKLFSPIVAESLHLRLADRMDWERLRTWFWPNRYQNLEEVFVGMLVLGGECAWQESLGQLKKTWSVEAGKKGRARWGGYRTIEAVDWNRVEHNVRTVRDSRVYKQWVEAHTVSEIELLSREMLRPLQI